MKNNLLLIGSKDFLKKFTDIYKEKIESLKFDEYIIDSENSLKDIDREFLKNYSKIVYLYGDISEDIYQLFDSLKNPTEISYFFNLESINLEFKNNLDFGIPHVSLHQIKKENYFINLIERIFALLVLFFISPILIIISIIMIISDGLPVLFSQKRVGLNGKKFIIYKFRTLKNSTPKYMSSSKKTYNYYTKIGLFLRKSNIDELPQFFNVFNGSMSFIGPRPEMPFIIEKYNFVEQIRLKVKPGVSGLWQLSRAREREIHENLEHDFDYIIKKSFLLDMKVFFQTAFRSFK